MIMGWSGGTEIFDTVAEELISANCMSEHDRIKVLTSLEDALSHKDWDNQCESSYWDDPVIGRILGNDFEEEGE
jgi:hypothetical protein